MAQVSIDTIPRRLWASAVPTSGTFFLGDRISITGSAAEYVCTTPSSGGTGAVFTSTVTPPSSDPGGQIVRSGFAVGIGGGSTLATAINALYLRPVRIQKGGTITSVTLTVTTAAASSVVRVGVYAHDGTTGLPGALIEELTATTTIDASTTGQKSVTGLSRTLSDNTAYWLGVVAQGATPTLSASDQGDSLLPVASGGNTVVASLFKTAVSGALPSTLAGSTYSQSNRMANIALGA